MIGSSYLVFLHILAGLVNCVQGALATVHTGTYRTSFWGIKFSKILGKREDLPILVYASVRTLKECQHACY